MKVTEDHIEKGHQRQACNCPISLAISDALDIQYRSINDVVSVTCSKIHYFERDYAVGPMLSSAILHYDDTGEMDPMELELVGNTYEIQRSN